eukprot:14402882-Alexandrium_andersonii.AAC.1
MVVGRAGFGDSARESARFSRTVAIHRAQGCRQTGEDAAARNTAGWRSGEIGSRKKAFGAEG